MRSTIFGDDRDGAGMAMGAERTRERWRLHLPPGPRSSWGLIWVVFWFLFLPDALRASEAVGGVRGWCGGIAAVIGVVAFSIGGWYSMSWLRRTGDVPMSQIWPWLAILVAAAAVVVWALRLQGLGITALIVVFVGFALSWRVTAAIVVPVAVLLYYSNRIWPGADLQGMTLAIVLAAAGTAFGRIGSQRRYQSQVLSRREHELEIADTRNRMARDLHDLLGHSLTVISVKTELAERLIDADPARARAELADVRSLTRTALAEVRATVNNYREVSLAAEIARADQMLSAAGIKHELPGAIDDVPEELRMLFAWALREGVTNVVRHSDAQRCRVELTRSSITVTDDGTGARASGSGGDASGGNGLLGLRQRAAEVGAGVRVGPAPDGTPARPGFQLTVDGSSAEGGRP